MRPRIISMSCLLMAATLMMAQGIQRHQYWIDADYGSAQSVVTGEESVSVEIPITGLSSGIHFLNYRALNTDDEWGTLNRTLFYVPEDAVGEATVSSHEYWLDSDHAHRVVGNGGTSLTASVNVSSLAPGIHFFNYLAKNNYEEKGALNRTLFYVPENPVGEATIIKSEYWIDNDYASREQGGGYNTITPTINVSSLSSGIHFFNYWAKNSLGDLGTLSRTLFYIPERALEDPTITAYEYWIDSNYAGRKTGEAENSITATIDVSSLSSGIHFFNYRAMNSFGEQGVLSRTLFYISDLPLGDPTITAYEYWIDNDYAGRKTGEAESAITATIDVSSLSSGIHFFNYRAKNSFDEQGTLSRTLFYIPEPALGDATITAYEYWLDGDMTTKVTGTEAQEVYQLTMDISELAEGDHAFFFRAKNSHGEWGVVHTESFVLTDMPGDVNRDGKVTITDVLMMLDKVHDKEPENFYMEAADVNCDKQVTYDDVIIVMDIILNSTE